MKTCIDCEADISNRGNRAVRCGECQELYRQWYKRKFNKANNYHRKDLILIMIKYKINGCVICGYDKCMASLDFHHVEPKLKIFPVNRNYIRIASSSDKIQEEIAKCVLLCKNCHGEIEEKLRDRCEKM